MSAAKLLSTNPQPLSQVQLSNLQPILKEMDAQQLTWLSGYMAGLAELSPSVQTQSKAQTSNIVITILYGSQTGNARSLAQEIHSKIKQKGLPTKLISMSDYRINQLKKEKWLVVVVSTQGNGEPPEEAIDFYEQLLGKRAPKIPNLNFSVLGLGDSSYDEFCQTAKEMDQRLETLGGKRFSERLDNDLDYQEDCDQWSASFITEIEPKIREEVGGVVIPLVPVPKDNTPVWTKQHPFFAELLLKQKITSRHSTQDVRHLELSLEGSGLTYQPGDALGVIAKNDSQLAQRILDIMKLDGKQKMGADFENQNLFNVLKNDYELTTPHPAFYEKWLALRNDQGDSNGGLNLSKEEINAYLEGKQIIDVMIEYQNVSVTALSFIQCLRKLTPRLYSISSSADLCEDEVHINVAKVSYEAFGFEHGGHASTYLSDRVEDGEEIGVYVTENPNFRLPKSGNTPIIMIGPGTGVAPFRAFMQQRDFNSDQGENWLFFGARHAKDDFLYQTEWLKYRNKGLLTHLDVAFSRDQKEKIYVQHVMRKKGKLVFEWLEKGAHLYICGAIQMGADVHETLKEIIQEEKECSEEVADKYLSELRKSKRYQKDVY